MIGQVVAAAVIGAVCAAVVKKQTPDLALVVTLCAVALILSTAMAALSPVRELIDVWESGRGFPPRCWRR